MDTKRGIRIPFPNCKTAFEGRRTIVQEDFDFIFDKQPRGLEQTSERKGHLKYRRSAGGIRNMWCGIWTEEELGNKVVMGCPETT